jgi:hypothetical protein
MHHLAKEAKYHIETNHGIHLNDNSLRAIDYAVYEGMRVAHQWTDKERVLYFNELRLWAMRNKKTEVIEIIEKLMNGESIR